jgi:hypothetical protein
MLGEVFIFSMIIWQLCEITYDDTSRVSLPHRSMELCVMPPPQPPVSKEASCPHGSLARCRHGCANAIVGAREMMGTG